MFMMEKKQEGLVHEPTLFYTVCIFPTTGSLFSPTVCNKQNCVV